MIFWILCASILPIAAIAWVMRYRGTASWYVKKHYRLVEANQHAIKVTIVLAAIMLAYCMVASVVLPDMASRGTRLFGFSYAIERTDVNSLYALNLGEGVQGEFFLASGGYGEVRYFTYLKEQKDGALTVQGMSAEDVLIYEDAIAPVISRIEYVHWDTLGDELWFPWAHYAGPTEVKFRIPPGSIIQDYTIKP